MAVQLLEKWLDKKQEETRAFYRELNCQPLKEPDIIFIGDSIMESYPITELFLTSKQLVNRGIKGYTSELLKKHRDVHIFGHAVDKIFILIGTNDIEKEISKEATIHNLEVLFHFIARNHPLTQIKLLSVLAVHEGNSYQKTVHKRNNQKIQELNQAYQELCLSYVFADYIDVSSILQDEKGNLAKTYTTDGLHLNAKGYKVLSTLLQKEL